MSYVLRKTSSPCRGWLRNASGDYSRNRADARRFENRVDAEAHARPDERAELLTASQWNADIAPSRSGFGIGAQKA